MPQIAALETLSSDDSNWTIFLITRVAILLLTAISVHISLSPPNPPVKIEECCSRSQGTNIFELFVQSITYCSKCMVWVGAFTDITLTILRRSCTLHAIAFLCPTSQNSINHPAMVIGAISTALGALLRLWCFRSLGPMFTFEISIRPKHQLVTSGPYAWVRHPSYAGVYLTLVGATLVLASPGTWVYEYGLKRPFSIVISCAWVCKCALAFRGMSARLRVEDGVLGQTFGHEWDEYARRVPFKLIPGVI